MKILVTGAAGFIGSKLSFELAKRGEDVVCVDNINDYYDVRLKYGRLAELGFLDNNAPFKNIPYSKFVDSKWFANIKFLRVDIEDKNSIDSLFVSENFDKVVNLAAQAGVRYSISHPYSYMKSNLEGFLNILEACRDFHVKKLVFASSSSVYGMNAKVPYCETDKVDTPVSLYAASKKSNELMAHCYSYLYNLQVIGLRYFTVYGPWGRPDMSPFLFLDAIRNKRPVRIYNNGDMIRDFTYIDDIVEGTLRAICYDLVADSCDNGVLYKIYNIGCGHPVKLMDFIREIESACGIQAIKEFLPMQKGDVYQTYADTSSLMQDLGYQPQWTLHEGIQKFVQWYLSENNPLK